MDHTTTETIYSGSKECNKCGNIMAPIEAMYSHDGATCATCRNDKMMSRVKNKFADKE
jgi:formylmethanofuran dehydrogenase subunit E